MTKQKIYISGQITGLDLKEAENNFRVAKTILSDKGYDVINPMDLVPYEPHLKWEDYMVADIDAVFGVQEMYMLNNWKQSKGAIIEHQIALNLKLKISYQ